MTSYTRGSGFLEKFLSRARARQAVRMIPDSFRDGKILDVGCGVHPHFLLRSGFRHKYGIDPSCDESRIGNGSITLLKKRPADPRAIPVDDAYFDAVTMLAVIEHMEPGEVSGFVREIHRVLKPGGIFLMTTPARWADGLLRFLALAGLVSRVEIEEHKVAYSHRTLKKVLVQAGFRAALIKMGYFQAGMNIAGLAHKEEGEQ
jgi:SAM-dependent methyltransferase